MLRSAHIFLFFVGLIFTAHAEPRMIVGQPSPSALSHSKLSALAPVALGTIGNAWGIAYDPVTRKIFASVPTTGSIISIDALTGSNQVTTWSVVGLIPHGLAVDAANRRLWYLDSGSDQVRSRMIDTNTAGPAYNLPGTGLKRPTDLAVDPIRKELLIADSASNSITRMSFAGTVLGTWSDAHTEDAWGVAVVPGGLVYASSYKLGTVYSWNPETGATALVASGLSAPRGLTIDRFGRLLCLASGTGTIMKLTSNPGIASAFTSYTNGRCLRCDDTSDEDDDLLPDAWELAYNNLGNLTTNSDPDGDGNSAFCEAAFGGRPDRFDSSFVTPIKPTNTTSLAIQFPVRQADGFSYRIWCSTNLINWWVPSVSLVDSSPINGYVSRKATLVRSTNGISANSPVFFRIESFKSADF